MAWSFTQLQSVADTTLATGYTTPSFTATAGRLLLASIGTTQETGSPTAPTVTSTNLTWSNIASRISGVVGAWLYAAFSGSGTTDTCSTNFGANQTGGVISIAEVEGAFIGGTIQEAFTQQATTLTLTNPDRVDITLTNPPVLGSRTFACFFTGQAGAISAYDSGWTGLASHTYTAPARRLSTAYSDAETQYAHLNQTTMNSVRGIAVELKSELHYRPWVGTGAGRVWVGAGSSPRSTTGKLYVGR